MTTGEQLGGCLCGGVRFRVGGHTDASYCHCTACRKASGSPVSAWAIVPAEKFSLEQGAPKGFDTGPTRRYFCGDCGSSLYLRDATKPHYSVALATLDDPASIPPRVHRSAGSQIGWFKMHDLLPVYDGDTPPAHDERTYWRGSKNDDVTAASVVSLRAITTENLRDTLLLDVAGPQRRFVALNSVSLAQARFNEHAWYRAVYADETAVGFVMMTREDEDVGGLPTKGEPFLWRFMIDERYQRLGFGKRAMAFATAEAATWDTPKAFWTSAVPGTGSPHDFYRRLGFQDTGVVDDGELVLRLPLDSSSS